MRTNDLPSPGSISNGLSLRTDVARAISFVESRSRKTSVVPDQLVTLRAFLDAASAKLTAIETEYFGVE